MNRKVVFYVVGKILSVGALLMIVPMIIALYYQESDLDIIAFFIPVVAMGLAGFLLSKFFQTEENIYTKEGLMIVSLSWILLSVFGCLPFIISRDIPSFPDAFFETVSGFTTTGATILEDVSQLSKSMLFWRSFTHLIGGMGILVFALAVLPKTSRESAQIMKAEVPGPAFGKIVSKIGYTARILYMIYFGMTALLIFFLCIGGMPLYDACLYAFGTAGTGGFGITNASVGQYQSTYLYNVITIGMIAFGVNFNVYYYGLVRRVKSAFFSEELIWYLSIILAAVALIFFNIYPMYENIWYALRDVFFSVASIITTTGYIVTDINQWPLFSKVIFLLLMFIGGCAGSTAGGLKVSRVIVCIKSAFYEIRSIFNPHRVHALKLEKKVVDEGILKGIQNYVLVYILLFTAILIWISFSVNDFQEAFSAVATTINNVGPGFSQTGTADIFCRMNAADKIALSFAMLIGRLEIFPILILFAPRDQ